MTDLATLALTPITPAPLAQAAPAADRAAARTMFADYRQRKAPATINAQDDDLACFARYLAAAGVQAGDLAAAPDAWCGLSWGLVEGFVRWQLDQGAAIASLNRRLATVKVYARLAHRAGALDMATYALIKTVSGYSAKEGRRVDATRTQTRAGRKKAQHTSLNTAQARALKDQPNTPQGRRDRLLVCLLVDHGLRVGELAGLAVEHIDLQAGTITFYRPKVDKTQTHTLTADTLRAALAYVLHDAPTAGPLWRGSRKGGALDGTMSRRAIQQRVQILGAAIGVPNLSPHDLRHFWATDAARNHTDPFALRDAGGWGGLRMVDRYVEAAAIANAGVKLSS